MNHIQISIEANEEQQEILISELAEFDAIGFEQTTSHLLTYFEEDKFKSNEVTKLLKDYGFHITILPEENWNAVWESNFEPVVVDDFCAIRAEFHKPIQNVEHEIIITPKMSFGTGHHATTYLMIQQMRSINFIGKKVFDFGTGTGILAILAGKLGATSITAIDNDEWSIKNAKENFQKNNIHSISLYQSSTVSENNFDIILANINRGVLEQYSSTLVNLLSPQGQLLVSGLLKDDEGFIVELFDELTLYNRQQHQNWISLLFGVE